MSSYNACREGFVFSNGDSYGVDGVPEFEPATIALLSAVTPLPEIAHTASCAMPPCVLREWRVCPVVRADACHTHTLA